MNPATFAHFGAWVKVTGLVKFELIAESTETVKKLTKANFEEISNREYIIYQQARLPGKKTKYVLLQLLNPGFDSKIKVFQDPWAAETQGLTFSDAQLTGEEDKSYFFVKTGGQAFKVKKGTYKKEFKAIFAIAPRSWKGTKAKSFVSVTPRCTFLCTIRFARSNSLSHVLPDEQAALEGCRTIAISLARESAIRAANEFAVFRIEHTRQVAAVSRNVVYDGTSVFILPHACRRIANGFCLDGSDKISHTIWNKGRDLVEAAEGDGFKGFDHLIAYARASVLTAHCEFQAPEFLNALEVNASYALISAPGLYNFRSASVDGGPERLVDVGIDIQVRRKPTEVEFNFSQTASADTADVRVVTGLGYCLP
jgi:hypothetical protein